MSNCSSAFECITYCELKLNENLKNCPCGEKCPAGCPCPEFDCSIIESKQKAIFVINTFSKLNEDQAVMVGLTGVSFPVDTFEMDSDSGAYWSCSFTLGGTMYIVGGLWNISILRISLIVI